jgi:PAS domain S-box-containing protein
MNQMQGTDQATLVVDVMELQQKFDALNISYARALDENEKLKDRLHQNEEKFQNLLAKQASDALVKQNEELVKLNQFALKLAMLAGESNLEETIIKHIREISGAEAVTFAEYNSATRTLSMREIEIEPGTFSKMVNIVGKNLRKMEIPVSDELYRQMTSEITGKVGTLHEASFGSISRPIGAAIELLVGVDRFLGIAYLIEGELYGTSVLAMRKGSKDPPEHILAGFANVAAVSLRRRRVEEDLRFSEEKFKDMADLLPQIVFETDEQGLLVYVNKMGYKIMGYEPDEKVIGLNTINFYIPEHRTRAVENIRRSVSGQVAIGGNEYTMLKKDGSEFQVLVYSSPISKGQVTVGLRGIIIDISERKIAEGELLNAKARAEESDRLKSTFLANMSHEIRTPMNGILGFAELLKEPELTGAEQERYISIIEKSGARLLDIINDIVDISKIESGQMEVRVSITNVNEMIEDIYTFFMPEAFGKGLEINYKCPLPPDGCFLNSDREKLIAILTNLVKNAIKYTNTGTINFGYEKKEDFLKFYVKDTGIGIPEDKLEAVFERFVQVGSSSRKALKGNGLGLSISKAYVEMLGGEIWLESKLGQGSVFCFTIPY